MTNAQRRAQNAKLRSMFRDIAPQLMPEHLKDAEDQLIQEFRKTPIGRIKRDEFMRRVKLVMLPFMKVS